MGALLVTSGAWAQNAAPAAVPLPPQAPPNLRAAQPAPAATTPIPYYDPDLDRLAEIMGTLAFMRTLCGNADGAEWHDKTEALIQAEGNGGAKTQRLAGSYNRGYRGYQLTYRTCTPSARTVITRALAEGDRLAKAISRRMGAD